jgi:ABC-type glycerol-3-phosphate transport system substrate-binding protein
MKKVLGILSIASVLAIYGCGGGSSTAPAVDSTAAVVDTTAAPVADPVATTASEEVKAVEEVK